MEFITTEQIHPSWDGLIADSQVIKLLERVDRVLCNSKVPFNPSPEHILRFAEQPLSEVKVLILGQDTYPAPGAATGRAFEINGLTSWADHFRQVSLKNICKRLYGETFNKSAYVKWEEVLSAIKQKEFQILPPDELFQSWSEQGVLLLNAALTCEVKCPGSHSMVWAPFTRMLLSWIVQQKPDISVFLWGNEAQTYAEIFTNPATKVYTSRHPMMCSQKYPDDFLKFTGFRATWEEINWLGQT